VIDADVSPDGQTIGLVLRAQEGGRFLLVDAGTGRIVTQLQGHRGQPRCLRFSPDGATIACGDSQQLVLFDARTHKPWAWGTSSEHAGQPGRLAFSADGRRLASGDDRGVVKVWRLPEDPQSQQAPLASERTFEMPALIHCVALSADGHKLAAGYAESQIWDVQTGRKLLELQGQEASFSPDGSLVVTGGGSLGTEAVIWDAQSGEERAKLSGGHAANIHCVLFYDDQHVVTGDAHGKLRCWNAQTGQRQDRFEGLLP
jgi:WD40 repeat protein